MVEELYSKKVLRAELNINAMCAITMNDFSFRLSYLKSE